MNCKNCSAPMELMSGGNYFYCEYCGTYAFPEPTSDGVVVLKEESELACPACSTRLSSAAVAGVPVLYCTNCRGVLTGQELFSDIVKRLRARASGTPHPQRPLDKKELQRRLHCPRCNQLMDTHPYYGPGNVVIDNCARCAVVWLDHGEIANIRDAPGPDRGD